MMGVASRQEQKERRRRERELHEGELAEAAARRRLRQRLLAALFVAAAVAVIALVAAAGGGSKPSASPSSDKDFPAVAAPAPRILNLAAAVHRGRCQLKSFPNYGQQHTTSPVKYKTNPPTSGNHDPTPAQDGAYAPGNSPPVRQTVHALEHGRVEIQWNPGLPRRQIGELKSVAGEGNGYHVLLFENETGMPFQLAATAWRHLLGCPKFSAAALDAVRAFRRSFTDKAPEQVP